ncbi:MAG: hypothetical protein JWO94_931 [Verrucomicrobiaceae bacterium]|nr:hypothetical protein [Verrucomicrobiaceae bacterium]
MSPYVLDFYCEEIRLAVELDGGSHVIESGLAYDRKRTHDLAGQGIRVVRISNYEMLMHTETLLNWLWRQVENVGKEPGDE